MRIYTKTGDNGTTRLVDGECVQKFNPRVEAYGSVDELNASLGVVRSHLLDSKLPFIEIEALIAQIQSELFSVGSLLATGDVEVFKKLPAIADTHIEQLEKWIDHYTEGPAELKNFILPSGHLVASLLHVSRTSCRRAERRSSEIMAKENHYQNVLIYLNRLSDLLFTWARWVNYKSNVAETIWKKS
ncbi:MAG: cob(I)yrinic acid a,c-diamide adenosyltransferase [Bdellovibrionaceae bacterium]|nr:cob(I)yrinic acid a,c-diamide adenosyltransferase [Bdellovibrio sp.]